MAINAQNDGGVTRELIEPGNYAARCYSIIHIGTIEDTYKGEKKQMNKVRIGWEIPELMRVFDEKKGPQPCTISKEFTLSTGEKANLRKMLASWRGKDFTEAEAKCFDVTVLIGKCCLLNVIHKENAAGDKTYEEIGSVSPMPKQMKCAPAINSPIIWDYDNFNAILLECLPTFIKDKIKTSLEYKRATDPTHTAVDSSNVTEAEVDDDLPF